MGSLFRRARRHQTGAAARQAALLADGVFMNTSRTAGISQMPGAAENCLLHGTASVLSRRLSPTWASKGPAVADACTRWSPWTQQPKALPPECARPVAGSVA